MGNYNSDNRDRGSSGNRSGPRSGGSGGFGGGRSGGFGGGRSGGRDGGRGNFRDRNSGRPEMHKATCGKCGKQCEVPFRPTGEKPVFCSDCFNKDGGSSSRGNNSSPGISSEQFKELNTKLDKVLEILGRIEFEEDEDDDDDEENKSEDKEDSEEESEEE